MQKLEGMSVSEVGQILNDYAHMVRGEERVDDTSIGIADVERVTYSLMEGGCKLIYSYR